MFMAYIYIYIYIYLVVSAHFNNMSQNGNLPQIGLNIKKIETTRSPPRYIYIYKYKPWLPMQKLYHPPQKKIPLITCGSECQCRHPSKNIQPGQPRALGIHCSCVVTACHWHSSQKPNDFWRMLHRHHVSPGNELTSPKLFPLKWLFWKVKTIQTKIVGPEFS